MKVLLVSNRLPVTVTKNEQAHYTFHLASGGLASSLRDFSTTQNVLWIGWPGAEIVPFEFAAVKTRLTKEFNAIPVNLKTDLAEKYYNRVSNSAIYPLLNSHLDKISFTHADWEAYRECNRLFAEVVLANASDGDLVWIHDYHLMLLPSILAKSFHSRNIKIGFSLHTTFPGSEDFSVFPVRHEILQSLLCCKLIGVHTSDIAKAFMESCARFLVYRQVGMAVYTEKNICHIGVFDMSVDIHKFHTVLQEPCVQDRIISIQNTFRGSKIIIGVDRLDYVKGLLQKLMAYNVFLDIHPECVGEVVLVQVVVPSRENIEENQKLKRSLDCLAASINSKHGNPTYTPIRLLHSSLTLHELTAFYAAADICIVSSTSDGLNLISMEYVAAQRDRHGSLLLSQLAGIAKRLPGSMLFNPWNLYELAELIFTAIHLGKLQRALDYKRMEEAVSRYSSLHWGQSFIEALIGHNSNS